jgi:hypothetical protein
MWTWLYKHPAHDRKYYETFVAKLDQPWRNDCPICDLVGQNCSDCLMQWDKQKGTFCTDAKSPFKQWRKTSTDNPDYRMLYAGEIIALAKAAMGKFAAG